MSVPIFCYGHNLVTLDFKAVQLRTDESKKGLIYI